MTDDTVASMNETRLLSETHLLVCIDLHLSEELAQQFELVKNEFCGNTWSDDEDAGRRDRRLSEITS